MFGMYKRVNNVVQSLCVYMQGTREAKGMQFWIEVKLKLVKEVYSFYG